MRMEAIRYRLNRLRGIRAERLRYCVRKCSKRSGRSAVGIFVDMCLSYCLYGAVYTDYLLFGFDTIPFRQRKDYLTRTRFHKLALWANPPEASRFIGSKYEFYKRYQGYMGRRMVRSDAPDRELDGFLADNPRFFIKPDKGTGGEGVHEVRREAFATNEELKSYVRSLADYVLDTPITQHHLMARFNADSVNTLRVVYLTADGKTHFLYCSLRVGRKDSRVDNLCAGGMICAIDTRHGLVSSDAFDNDGNLYSTHPDAAGLCFRGMPVPYLPEALTLTRTVAEKLYREVSLGLVGFDVAVTPDGPVLLEANAYPTHYGWQRPGFTDKESPTGLWKKIRGIMQQGTPAS